MARSFLGTAGQDGWVGGAAAGRLRPVLSASRRSSPSTAQRVAPRAYTSVGGPMRTPSPAFCSGAM